MTLAPPEMKNTFMHSQIDPAHLARYTEALAASVGDVESSVPSVEALILGSLVGRDARMVHSEFSTARFIAEQVASLATVDTNAIERQMDEAEAAENRASLELARVMREVVEPAKRAVAAAKAKASDARGVVAAHAAEVAMVRQQGEAPVVAAILKANDIELPAPLPMPEGQIGVSDKLVQTYHDTVEQLQTASGPERESLLQKKLHLVTTLNKAIKSLPHGDERKAAEAHLAAAMSPRIKSKPITK